MSVGGSAKELAHDVATAEGWAQAEIHKREQAEYACSGYAANNKVLIAQLRAVVRWAEQTENRDVIAVMQRAMHEAIQ
jgi:hypothetical protein